MVERAGALHTNRPEEEAAREALKEALFDDTRSGQGFCLTALLGTLFWAIILWVTIWR